MADEPVVLYEERQSLAIITLNRPEKMNTLTDMVIQGIADAIDEATASPEVSSVIIRGAGPCFTAGYDLNPRADDRGRGPQRPRYGAAHVDARPGAWDPVRDYAFMGHNMRRFMKLWECPKPVIAELHGYALGGGTDLILCADLIFMAEDAIIGRARDEANRQAEEYLGRAQAALRQETEAARQQLRQEVADLAVLAASKIVRKELDPADQTRLIEEALAGPGGAE